MNASIPAALLMLLLAGGWWLGRRRARPFLRSTDTSAVAALNRTQIERLQARRPASAEVGAPEHAASVLRGPSVTPAAAGSRSGQDLEATMPPLPLQARDRRRLLRQLQAWMAGTREQRLQALAIAAQSSRRDVLPLLHRGLRDPDPAVMAASAAAMARFRGRSAADRQAPADLLRSCNPTQPGKAATSPPRRVLRTR
jgi:hypothetical protein